MREREIVPADRTALNDASRALVVQGGLRNLSLRSVARASGWTMGELAWRIGKKEQLIAQLIANERTAWQKADRVWLDRLAGTAAWDARTLASVVAAYIDDITATRRASAVVRDEMLVKASLDPDIRTLVAPWIEDSERFWLDLLSDRHDYPEAMARLIADYVASEQLYSVALGSDPAYRLIRGMCIGRLCDGLLGDSDGKELALFDSLRESRQPVASTVLAMGARAGAVAEAAAQLMMTQGVASVTHRAVAASLGQTASAVVHHFRTHVDLVGAGVEALYAGLRRGIDVEAIRGRLAGGQAPLGEFVDPKRTGVPLSRATYMITLAATREPSFTPLAWQRRMDRGVTSAFWMGELFQEPERFDRCSAQLVSLILGSAVLRSAIREEPYDGYLPDVVEDLTAISR